MTQPPYLQPSSRAWSTAASQVDARAFHQSLPGYAVTPLVELPSLADELGVGRLLVKDESARIGLPAFKILGASWACRQVLDRHPGAELVTATDGNHGRAVARMARHFGTRATIFVPGVMLEATQARIAGEGAQVVRVEGSYDDAVRAAADFAGAATDRELVQDTAWPGYEEVPGWIIDGYRTLLREIDETLRGAPDLVAVPVGVGSLAQAVATHYRREGAPHPVLLCVEPDTAACLLSSLHAGRMVSVDTADTVMAGMNCGTVSSLAWPVLSAGVDAAVTVTDAQALQAADDLAALGVSAGPCGAAQLAGLRAILSEPGAREALGVRGDETVVLISTEGPQS